MSNPWETSGPEQQGPQIPPQGRGPSVPPRAYQNSFWYVWSALLIKIVISMAVSMIAVGVYSFYYISNHYEEAMTAMKTQGNMMEFSMQISSVVMKYATILEGLTALIVIPVILFMFHKDRKMEKQLGIVENRKAPLWKYVGVAGISAAMCIGLNNLIILGNLSNLSEGYQQTSEALYSASFPVQILCLGILVPIAEELVFRGMMFKRMRGQASYRRAAVYSSLVFGLFHGNLVQMLYAFALGMMLTYVYEKYGSVKAPIVAHMVMNLISVIATQYRWFDWMVKDTMRIGIITVACAAIAATMFVWIQRIEEKPEISDKYYENIK